jgi:large subunit ribosomal protein L15
MSKRKIDRLRGQRTHGRGNTKNGRGGGCKGGKGRAGAFKHKRFTFYEVTSQPKKRLHPKPKQKAITLDQLNFLIVDKKEIDLKEMGYDKILGSGNLTKPVVIKNAIVTQKAKQKIEAAGGKIE